MRSVYGILAFIMLVCFGCQWQLRPSDDAAAQNTVGIQRYDRIESLYLTTGDYSALQQMNTYFPMQTRMLIEDVLHLGKVNDPTINTKFLYFFQDSTLQRMLSDVQLQYADMDDIAAELSEAFLRLRSRLPDMEIPEVYTQISSFDQSIIVGNNTLGISLDKYLGADYPFYLDHYSAEQRAMMTRSMIVPDCVAFYLLSLYPLSGNATQQARDQHMGRIQHTVNTIVGRRVFDNALVRTAEQYVRQNPSATIPELLIPASVAAVTGE